jgi:methionyl-tRNA formyltransferase
MPALNVIFMGTADLSCATLAALLTDPSIRVAAVVTQPDKPHGRHLVPQPPAVKILAATAGLPVLQPARARDPAFLTELAAFQPDLIVVAAYGQILPATILDLPRHGCINVHTSLLPKYRGAAPIQWAIAQGDPETGVTIMKMDVGMDTGAILTQRPTPITPEDTGATLHDRLAQLGAELLLATLPGYLSGEIKPQPQPAEGVTHAPKIKKEDGRVDWQRPATEIWNRFRAFLPWPGAYTSWTTPTATHTLKLWAAQVAAGVSPAESIALLPPGSTAPAPVTPGTILAADKTGILVACGEHALRITELQREGGRRLTAREFLAGHPLRPGEKLG